MDQIGQNLGPQPVARALRKVVGTVSRRQDLGNLLHGGIVGKLLVSGGRPAMGGWTRLPGEFCFSMAYGIGESCVWRVPCGLWCKEIRCVAFPGVHHTDRKTKAKLCALDGASTTERKRECQCVDAVPAPRDTGGSSAYTIY